MKRSVLLFFGCMLFLSSCGSQGGLVSATTIPSQTINIKDLFQEESLVFRINLSGDSLSLFVFELNSAGWLRAISASGAAHYEGNRFSDYRNPKEEVVQLSANDFEALLEAFRALDWLHPPIQTATDVLLVYFSREQASGAKGKVAFAYGNNSESSVSDRQFVDFVTKVISLSPMPVMNNRGEPITPYFHDFSLE
jgi:hypothetical protein